jgi:hypothetical protein
MIKKVAFTMYHVSDMKRAINFYKNTLNMEPNVIAEDGHWTEYDLPQGGCFALADLTKLQDLPIELSKSSKANASSDLSPCVAFEVDDLDKIVVDLREKNIEITMEYDIDVCKGAAILDSEGNGVFLHQLKPR